MANMTMANSTNRAICASGAIALRIDLSTTCRPARPHTYVHSEYYASYAGRVYSRKEMKSIYIVTLLPKFGAQKTSERNIPWTNIVSTFRDLWPRNDLDPFVYCDATFSGHYVATIKVATSLIRILFLLMETGMNFLQNSYKTLTLFNGIFNNAKCYKSAVRVDFGRPLLAVRLIELVVGLCNLHRKSSNVCLRNFCSRISSWVLRQKTF